MPAWPAVLGHRTIGDQELLGVTRGLESLQVPVLLAGESERVLRPVVQGAVLPVFDAREELPLDRAIAGQPIGDEAPWHVPAAFEVFAEARLGRVRVPPAWHQEIEHRPIVIHRPPEIMAWPGA
jgi:hypothetical protein